MNKSIKFSAFLLLTLFIIIALDNSVLSSYDIDGVTGASIIERFSNYVKKDKNQNTLALWGIMIGIVQIIIGIIIPYSTFLLSRKSKELSYKIENITSFIECKK